MSTKKKTKAAPSTAPKKVNQGPSLRIQYDKDQYDNHYNHMVANLVKIFPTLKCYGQKAPPSAKGMAIAFAIFALQTLLAVSVFFGEKFLRDYFGIVLDPQVYTFLKDYQMLIMLPIILITPLMKYAARNGAYEIYLNEVRIFSKLETDQLPSLAYVKEILSKKGIKAIEQ